MAIINEEIFTSIINPQPPDNPTRQSRREGSRKDGPWHWMCPLNGEKQFTTTTENVSRRVRIRCAQGDSREYPLADIEISLRGEKHNIRAAISDTLPVPVLLGRDVTSLVKILQNEKPDRRSRSACGDDQRSSQETKNKMKRERSWRKGSNSREQKRVLST